LPIPYKGNEPYDGKSGEMKRGSMITDMTGKPVSKKSRTKKPSNSNVVTVQDSSDEDDSMADITDMTGKPVSKKSRTEEPNKSDVSITTVQDSSDEKDDNISIISVQDSSDEDDQMVDQSWKRTEIVFPYEVQSEDRGVDETEACLDLEVKQDGTVEASFSEQDSEYFKKYHTLPVWLIVHIGEGDEQKQSSHALVIIQNASKTGYVLFDPNGTIFTTYGEIEGPRLTRSIQAFIQKDGLQNLNPETPLLFSLETTPSGLQSKESTLIREYRVKFDHENDVLDESFKCFSDVMIEIGHCATISTLRIFDALLETNYYDLLMQDDMSWFNFDKITNGDKTKIKEIQRKIAKINGKLSILEEKEILRIPHLVRIPIFIRTLMLYFVKVCKLFTIEAVETDEDKRKASKYFSEHEIQIKNGGRKTNVETPSFPRLGLMNETNELCKSIRNNWIFSGSLPEFFKIIAGNDYNHFIGAFDAKYVNILKHSPYWGTRFPFPLTFDTEQPSRKAYRIIEPVSKSWFKP
jgi:hypothetical protein